MEHAKTQHIAFNLAHLKTTASLTRSSSDQQRYKSDPASCQALHASVCSPCRIQEDSFRPRSNISDPFLTMVRSPASTFFTKDNFTFSLSSTTLRSKKGMSKKCLYSFEMNIGSYLCFSCCL